MQVRKKDSTADFLQVIRMFHPLEDEAEGLKKSLLQHLIRDVAEEKLAAFFDPRRRLTSPPPVAAWQESPHAPEWGAAPAHENNG
jgi:hypothetical protein